MSATMMDNLKEVQDAYCMPCPNDFKNNRVGGNGPFRFIGAVLRLNSLPCPTETPFTLPSGHCVSVLPLDNPHLLVSLGGHVTSLLDPRVQSAEILAMSVDS